MGQGVHAGGGGEALRHGIHHLGVDDGDDGHVVRVHADELAAALQVGDDVVYRDLGGGAGGRRDGDYRHAGALGVRDALKTAHVRELGVVDDDADGLGGIHGAAAADGDYAVRARGLKSGDAGLDVLNGGVFLDIGEDLVGDALGIQQVRHLGDDAVFEDGGAAADQRLLEPAGLDLARDGADCARAVIGGLVEHDAVYHFELLLSNTERLW